jgi:capsular exopolysaccharide synthesis family protein
MSRIYDALKKLEAERSGGAKTNGSGNGSGNGGGNGRRGWRRLFGGNGQRDRARMRFALGPEAEEAYQRLGTSLLVPGSAEAGPVPRLVAVTASRHGEGTTTTSAVFASILARRRGGRVAAVEANLRSPSFDTVFGIRRDGGLAELIQGQKALGEVVLPTEVPNLFAIGCGHSTLGPPALLDSPGVAAALDQLRGHFDFVVFDLPPTNVYGDACILGHRLDAALIVIEADRTRMSEVERTRRTLERAGVRVVGSVLNRRRNYIPAFLDEML